MGQARSQRGGTRGPGPPPPLNFYEGRRGGEGVLQKQGFRHPAASRNLSTADDLV